MANSPRLYGCVLVESWFCWQNPNSFLVKPACLLENPISLMLAFPVRDGWFWVSYVAPCWLISYHQSWSLSPQSGRTLLFLGCHHDDPQPLPTTLWTWFKGQRPTLVNHVIMSYKSSWKLVRKTPKIGKWAKWSSSWTSRSFRGSQPAA